MPPTLPVRLVRPIDPELAHLRRENQRLVAQSFELGRALETEQRLVELLRQQLKELQDEPSQESTEPGLGLLGPALQPTVTQAAPRAPTRGRWGRRHWLTLGATALSLAAAGAATRYPQLLAPLRYLDQHLPDILDLFGVLQ